MLYFRIELVYRYLYMLKTVLLCKNLTKKTRCCALVRNEPCGCGDARTLQHSRILHPSGSPFENVYVREIDIFVNWKIAYPSAGSGRGYLHIIYDTNFQINARRLAASLHNIMLSHIYRCAYMHDIVFPFFCLAVPENIIYNMFN